MNTQKTMQAIVQVCGSIDPSLGKMVSDTESKLGKINTKALAAGAAAGAIAVGVGKAVIEAGKYLNDLGKDYNKTLNSISASTGATGDELTSIGETVKDVYASNFGDSFEDVGKSVSEVKKQTGLLGDDLTVATKSAYLLSDAFEYDIGDTSKAASALIKNLGVDAEEAYNIIAYGAQNGADRSGDMLDSINEYAVQYKSLGLTAEEMMSGFVTAGENGVFMIDKVGDAVKEFNIRSKDGSDSSKEGFELIGMNAEKMFSTFAKGGDDANKAFYEVVNALDKMEDPVKKNQAAVALFGTQYEDLEKDILPILSSMQDATLDNIDTLSQINDVKYDDIDSALEGIKRQVEVNMLPLANVVANGVNDLAPVLGDAMEELGPVITSATNELTPIITDLFTNLGHQLGEFLPQVVSIIAELSKTVLPPLIELISALLPVGMEIINSIMPILLDLLKLIMPILVQLIQLCLPVISQLLLAIMPIINELVNGPLGALFTALMGLMSEAAGPLGTVISFLASMFTERLSGALQAIMPIVTAVLNIFTNLINFITNIFTGNWSAAWQNVVNIFSNIFSGIGAYLKLPINGVITKINSFIAGVNSISIPDWVPGVGGKSLSISKIPLLASGGFTNGPSIAGEVPGQTEAVISFLPQFRKENIELWQQAGQMLGVMPQQETPLQLAGQLATLDDYSLADAGATTIIYYDFSGFEYHPEFHNNSNNNDNEKTFMQEVEENKFEFADWLIAWFSTILED